MGELGSINVQGHESRRVRGLSKQIDAHRAILDLNIIVNGMVVGFRALAADVTRVMLEVGSQGKLGSQAHVADVEGVNRVCFSLTDDLSPLSPQPLPEGI